MRNASSVRAVGLRVGAIVLIPTLAAAAPRSAPPATTMPGPAPLLQVQQTIPLACSGSGASDVASRKHSIKNTAGKPIPKGTVLQWTASNSGMGKVTLQADLLPNASVDVIEPGQTNGYTCTASFLPGPVDFVLKDVRWTSETKVSVEIANANAWRDAGASTARVWSMKCVSSVLMAVDVPVPAIPKGGSTTITVDIAKAGADYLMALANVTNAVAETNMDNNVRKSPEFGSTKTCTPH